MFSNLKIPRTIALGLVVTAALLPVVQTTEASVPLPGCQCTDFVYSQRPDLPTTMGRAKDFLYSSRIHRFPYDQVPQVGDVAVFLRGEHGFSAYYGHVAYVIAVNEERDRISIAGWNGLVADCKLQIHLDLAVTRNMYFIHHKEPVKVLTLPLEEWIALEGEGRATVFERLSVCEPDENGNVLRVIGCQSSTYDLEDEGLLLDFEQVDLIQHLPHLNFFLE